MRIDELTWRLKSRCARRFAIILFMASMPLSVARAEHDMTKGKPPLPPVRPSEFQSPLNETPIQSNADTAPKNADTAPKTAPKAPDSSTAKIVPWDSNQGPSHGTQPALPTALAPEVPQKTGAPVNTPTPAKTASLQPFSLPPASRARMHQCGLEWQQMKLSGAATNKTWRVFAQACLKQ
ncbi:hypothetical protein Bind_1875 [Beijerinckia indica subsp. indica ATCC 9039]|uniref:Uncharacterized protein n=2 Tax=Beijerinckia TaxID=532 RepID=B2IEA1_BEII9|nr:hypothetical protein Bind_1875 [Beijerinckia indica subsp. indica ATCC 9039]